jgi:asparagine N-glycosylation enzyme membrane subunit Stt3
MDVAKKQKWAKIREQGRMAYVLKYGVVGWGVPTGVMFSIVMAAMQGWERFWVLLAVSLILFPIGGIAFGVLTWKASESKYQEAVGQPTD